WRTYIIFAVFCVAMTIHVFFMFPETSGKRLEDVTAIFEDPHGIPNIGTPAWKTKNSFKKTRALEKGQAAEDLEAYNEKGMHRQSESDAEKESPDRMVEHAQK
ncbi:hypothetical protein LTS18_014069, partial [Coniosporium uncinatum]